jgi:16S rRNA processing protein RimM
MTEKIVLAVVGAPHGTRGEVRIKSFTEDPLDVGSYGALQTADGRSFVVESVRPAKEVVIARLSGVDTRDKAEALKNERLFVPRERLPAPDDTDTFYQSDLIGLLVKTADGTPVGRVKAVLNYGAGDILEIAPARGAPVLLPFTKDYVPVIDIAGRRIIAAPPDGLFDDEDASNSPPEETDV